MSFTKATKTSARGRIALCGISGSGKTWTALKIATVLAGSDTIALIDTENGSASKYADVYSFDTMQLQSFTPRSYIAAIHEAEQAGYRVLVIDSLSHAWSGKDGVLALVDQATSRSKSGNAFTSGWREVTPEHNALIDALVQCKCDLVVTMRSKTEYVIDDAGNGKKMPRKIGMAPVQRDGMEYEFDLVGDMDAENTLVVTKSRCSSLSGAVVRKPDEKFAETFRNWLRNGVVPAAPKLATAEQVRELRELLNVVKLPEGTVAKWLAKSGVEILEDMTSDTIDKCTAYVKNRLPNPIAAA